MHIGDEVFDAAEGTGKVTRLYRENGLEMATVEYDSPQWNGDFTLDWDVRDLRVL